jgi:hypothetical protein
LFSKPIRNTLPSDSDKLLKISVYSNVILTIMAIFCQEENDPTE